MVVLCNVKMKGSKPCACTALAIIDGGVAVCHKHFIELWYSGIAFDTMNDPLPKKKRRKRGRK